MSNTVTLFKNYHGNVHVALKSGRTVAFINGKFFTTERALENELMDAAETGEFGIYIDSAETEIDPQYATPMDQLKKKLRDELLEELKAGGRLVDAGVSVEQPLRVASSQTVAGQGEATEAQRILADQQRQLIENGNTKEVTVPTNTTFSSPIMIPGAVTAPVIEKTEATQETQGTDSSEPTEPTEPVEGKLTAAEMLAKLKSGN